MKIFTGEAIRKAIPANYATYDGNGYIIVYPAPKLFMIPVKPAYGYVFSEVWTCTPGKYPGGAYTCKKYVVSTNKNTFPRKYKNMIELQEVAK